MALCACLLAGIGLPGCATHEPIVTPRIEQLSTAIERYPDDYRLYSSRAFAYATARDEKSARRDLRRAKELGPTMPSIRWSAGWIEFNTGNYEAALAEWTESIAMRPEPPTWAGWALALGHWRLGEHVVAMEHYDAALKLEANSDFRRWNTLMTRTQSWTWHEKETIYDLHSAWQRSYREGTLPRGIEVPPSGE